MKLSLPPDDTRPRAVAIRLLARLLWLVELAVVRTLAALLRALSFRARLRFGHALGRFGFRIDHRHANVALDNLAAAYPDADAAWRRRTAVESFEHLGRLLVEILSQRDVEGVARRMDVEGWEHVEAAAAAGKGYFVVTAHFGNWEWANIEHGRRGRPLAVVARPLDNPYLERWFAGLRTATGSQVIYKRNAIREMVRALRTGLGVALVIDQDFPEKGGEFVPFFGKLAATTPALGTLALRLGVPVIPVFVYPRDDGSYRLVHEPPLVLPTSGDDAADARAITAEATRHIEEAVRRQPGAWFWMHRRWRTRPPADITGA